MLRDFSILQESPFTDQGSVVDIFTDLTVWFGIKKVIDTINDNAADHQQRQHTEEGFGLNALTNLPSQFYIPPLSWFLCSPHPASCGCS